MLSLLQRLARLRFQAIPSPLTANTQNDAYGPSRGRSAAPNSIWLRLAIVTVLVGQTPSALAALDNLAPVTVLPTDKLLGLIPLLRKTDLALVESKQNGTLKQLTVMTLVAAPPAAVRDAVLRADRYGDFVRNMKKSAVTMLPDGVLEHTYEFSYTLFSLTGQNRIVQLPDNGRGAVPPLQIYDPDPSWSGNRQSIWEFYPAGGGTMLVMYGYVNVLNSGGLVDKLLKRVPSLEHGLALVSQMTFALSMKSRAESMSGPVQLPPPGPAVYDFLLERGTLVLLRASNGRLSEVSLITRSQAPAAALLQTAQNPGNWSQFIPIITSSREIRQPTGSPLVEVEESLPLLSFRTTYGVQSSTTAADLYGLSGDLRGSRLRWDITTDRSGLRQVVLRASQSLDQASIILRQLYKLEPLFEYGINVGLDLVLLHGLTWQVEKSTVPMRASAP